MPDLQAHSPAVGQKDGEKWTAAVDLQPTLPKSDRLLGAALWRGNSCSQGEQLEEVELESVANTAIELLDSLMEDCATEGVFETARAAKAAGVH